MIQSLVCGDSTSSCYVFLDSGLRRIFLYQALGNITGSLIFSLLLQQDFSYSEKRELNSVPLSNFFFLCVFGMEGGGIHWNAFTSNQYLLLIQYGEVKPGYN